MRGRRRNSGDRTTTVRPGARSASLVTPKTIVGLVAGAVALLVLFGGDIRRALVARFDPRISFEEREGEARGRADEERKSVNADAPIFEGEVYRTEGRLREASAVAVAASLAGVAGFAERRPARNVDELLTGVARRGLLPPGVEFVPERRLLVSEHSTLHLRFRPEPFAIEVLSLGRQRRDGPGLLVRVPDEPNDERRQNRGRYFYSLRLEDVTVPEAFANAAAVQAAGWQVDHMQARLPDGVNAQHLAAWTRAHQQVVNSATRPTR